MAFDEHLPECPHMDYKCEGDEKKTLEGVEGWRNAGRGSADMPHPDLWAMVH